MTGPRQPTRRAVELAQRLESSSAFEEFAQRLVPVFFEYEEKRGIVAELRSWVDGELRAAGLVGDERAELCEAIVGAVIGAALPKAAANRKGGATRSHDRGRRKAIRSSYPFPIACPFERAGSSEEDATARYAALLDTFEALLIFLIHTQVSQYLRTGGSEAAFDRALVDLLIRKQRLTTGDWATLLLSSARAFVGFEASSLFYPELVPFLIDERGKPTPQAEVLIGFCHVRNRYWGHAFGRGAELYEQRLALDLPILEEELAAMTFLEGTELIVPTRIDGSRVVEGRVYLGSGAPGLEQLELELDPDDLPDRGGWVRLNTSILLTRDSGHYVPLFPFFRYRDAADRVKRGIYFLTEMQWAAGREGRSRLKKAMFVPQRVGGAPEDDSEAREFLEQAFGRLLGAKAPDAQIDPATDRDLEEPIPAVWAELEEHRHAFVGRGEELAKVEAQLLAWTGHGGVVLIHGGPGIGKTAFMCALHDRLVAFAPLLHLVRANRSPRTFLAALLQQCGERLGRPLGRSAVAADSLEGLRSSLERAMAEVARRCGRCVALVDGLDELESSLDGWERALEWLPRALPPGVAFVVSARPLGPLLDALRARVSASRRLELALPPLSPSDFPAFVAQRAGDLAPRIPEVLDTHAAFARLGGYPIFLRTIVDEAVARLRDAGVATPARIDLTELPSGTRAILANLYSRLMDRSGMTGNPRLRRRTLEYLCLSIAPGPSLGTLRRMIERALEVELEVDDVGEVVASMSAYMRETSAGRHLPFHAMLTEYVLSELDSTDVQRRHGEMAAWLEERGARDDPIYWRAAITHHVWSGGHGRVDLTQHLLDPGLIEARLKASLGLTHGEWLRRHAEELTSDEATRLTGRLVAGWGRGSARFESLDREQREQLLDLLTEAAEALPGLWPEIARGLEALGGDTPTSRLLTREAWVRYQALDEWQHAHELLTRADALLAAAEDPLERALCRRLHAAVLFDLGTVEEHPLAMLESECLPVFERLQLHAESAATLETMAVVVDAEGDWDRALGWYTRAHAIYTTLGDDEGRTRTSMNRSVAALFTQGLEAARLELRGTRAADGSCSRRLGPYLATNEAILALFSGDLGAFDAAARKLEGAEVWVRMSHRETAAVRDWFDGRHDEALAEMRALADQFDGLGDAWGAIDNRINAAFLFVTLGRRDDALRLLDEVENDSRLEGYPLGAALHAEAGRRLGRPDGNAEAIAFYERHLAFLFRSCPSPFVPCYVLALP